MNKKFLCLIFTLLLTGCKEEVYNPFTDDNTASGSMICIINQSTWSADMLQAYKVRDTLFLKGIKLLPGDSIYSSLEINFKVINATQPGTFGIGENESGLNYFVKGNYMLKSSTGLADKVYTAYYKDYSLMVITGLSDRTIAAEFRMKLFNYDFSDSLIISNGRFNITY